MGKPKRIRRRRRVSDIDKCEPGTGADLFANPGPEAVGDDNHISIALDHPWIKPILQLWEARYGYFTTGDPISLPRKQSEAPQPDKLTHDRVRSTKE